MNVLADLKDVRSSIHSKLTQNPDEALFGKILDELRATGGNITKDVGLVMEIVKQKASKKPLDDRSMLVSYILFMLSRLLNYFILTRHRINRWSESFNLWPNYPRHRTLERK